MASSVDINTYCDVPARRLMPYRVRRFVNPSEFYLEYDSFCGVTSYHSWFADMQNHFGNRSHQNILPKAKVIPVLGYCYACFNPEDGQWHRVRVHKLTKGSSGLLDTVIVFYVDLCKMAKTTIQYLSHLPPKFGEPCAQVFRCYLFDIVPTGAASEWTPEAHKYLEEQMKNKAFSGVILMRSTEFVTETDELPDLHSTYGVVLVENQPDSQFPREDVCTLNAQMVDAGHALAIGVSAGCKHSTEVSAYKMSEQTFIKDWFKDHREKSEDEVSEVIEFRLAKLILEIGQPERFYKNTTDYFPDEFSERMAHINLVHVAAPSFIIVHLKSYVGALEAMQDSLKAEVESQGKVEEMKDGSFVACHALRPSTDETSSTYWARGVVKSAGTEANTYEVLLIDYGVVVSVSNEHLRVLPGKFELIPSFAIRVHLDEDGLVPIGKKGWEKAAVTNFCKYLAKWQDRNPIYFAYRHGEVLALAHFEQKLVYNFPRRKWIVVPGKGTSNSFAAIDNLKDHPMVHSFYYSIGMTIDYEIVVPGKDFWFFSSISDVLVERKNAVKKVSKRSKVDLHVQNVDAAQVSMLELVAK